MIVEMHTGSQKYCAVNTVTEEMLSKGCGRLTKLETKIYVESERPKRVITIR